MDKIIDNLTKNFMRLPTVGPKTATRLAFHLISSPCNEIESLASAILSVKDVKFCIECGNITEADLCGFCSDDRRDRSIICVVEQPNDVMTIEQAKRFSGLYHILGGAISHLDGITPEMLRIAQLLKRVGTGLIKEVIIATNPNMEGDATALYLSKLLSSYDLKVTRIGFGLPVGGDLEYADPVTMARSLEARREMK
jgi:recombination protein RecR